MLLDKRLKCNCESLCISLNLNQDYNSVHQSINVLLCVVFVMREFHKYSLKLINYQEILVCVSSMECFEKDEAQKGWLFIIIRRIRRKTKDIEKEEREREKIQQNTMLFRQTMLDIIEKLKRKQRPHQPEKWSRQWKRIKTMESRRSTHARLCDR